MTASIEPGNLDLFVRHAKVNNFLVGTALPIILGKARTEGVKASLDRKIWGVCSHKTTVTSVSDDGINVAYESTILADNDGPYTIIETRTPLRNAPTIQSQSSESGYTGDLFQAYSLLGGKEFILDNTRTISHVIEKETISRHAAINTLLEDSGFTRNPARLRNAFELAEPLYKTFDFDTFVSVSVPIKSVRLLYNWDYSSKVFRNIDVMAVAGSVDEPLDLEIKSVVSVEHAREYGRLFLDRYTNGLFKCEVDKRYRLGDTFLITDPNVSPGSHATVIAVDKITDESELEIWTPSNCKANLISSTQHTERLSTDRQVNESVSFANGLVTYQILDADGLGIPDAIVTLNNSDVYITDADGSFIFQANSGDQFSVVVELGGETISEFDIII